MRPIASFSRFGGKTVLLAPQSSLDDYGKPSYGADVPYSAHIVGKQEMVRDAEQKQVTSKQQVWVFSTNVIPTTSRLTLSTADVGSTEATETQPKILTVVQRWDGPTLHHSVIYL